MSLEEKQFIATAKIYQPSKAAYLQTSFSTFARQIQRTESPLFVIENMSVCVLYML